MLLVASSGFGQARCAIFVAVNVSCLSLHCPQLRVSIVALCLVPVPIMYAV